MVFDKEIRDGVMYRTITFSLLKEVYVLASGWSLKKGDWWYEDNPSEMKFFDIRKSESKTNTRYGVYIARLALTLMKGKC